MERHSTFTQMRHFVVGSWICALASLAWLASFVVTPESWNGIGESWRAWVIAREHAEFAELANARAAGPEAEIRALERWIDGHASVTASDTIALAARYARTRMYELANERGDSLAARTWSERAVAFDAHDALARTRLAVSDTRDAGRRDEGIAELRRLLRRFPDNEAIVTASVRALDNVDRLDLVEDALVAAATPHWGNTWRVSWGSDESSASTTFHPRSSNRADSGAFVADFVLEDDVRGLSIEVPTGMCARVGQLELSIAEGPSRPLTFFGPRFEGLMNQGDGFLATGELRGSVALDVDHEGPCRVRLCGTVTPSLPRWVVRQLVGEVGIAVRRKCHDEAPFVAYRLRAIANDELDVEFDGKHHGFHLDGDVHEGAIHGRFEFGLPADVRECTVTLGDVWADLEIVRLDVEGGAPPFRIDWSRSDRCRQHDLGAAATGAGPRIVFVREKSNLDPHRVERARLEVVLR